jgi:hypothetical protein
MQKVTLLGAEPGQYILGKNHADGIADRNEFERRHGMPPGSL